MLSSPDRLRIVVLCYYLLNRPPSLINPIVLFDLVSNFLGITDHIDSLIISILKKVTVSGVYDSGDNSKLTVDAHRRMISIMYSHDLSWSNTILSLPIYTKYNITPPVPEIPVVGNSIVSFKFYENIIFYIKYASNISVILRDHPDFIMGCEWMVELSSPVVGNRETVEYSKGVVENREIYERIRETIKRSGDREKEKERMIEYISKI